jgi:hypothetical protein
MKLTEALTIAGLLILLVLFILAYKGMLYGQKSGGYRKSAHTTCNNKKKGGAGYGVSMIPDPR